MNSLNNETLTVLLSHMGFQFEHHHVECKMKISVSESNHN